MPSQPLPPLDFLLESSLTSLQDLELAALNRSSNLGKGIKRELEQWIEQSATAMLARWMIENRDALLNRELRTETVDFFEARKHKKSA